MRGDEKCPFSGATDYGSVWSKGAGKRGVESAVTGFPLQCRDVVITRDQTLSHDASETNLFSSMCQVTLHRSC